MPVSGERVSRRFLRTEKVSALYDFIDFLNINGECSFEADTSRGAALNIKYNILQVLGAKRIIYDDKALSLQDAGLYPGGAILQI